MATRGGKAEATVYASNEKFVATLEPAEENMFIAKGSFKTVVGVRVALTVSLPGPDLQPQMKSRHLRKVSRGSIVTE